MTARAIGVLCVAVLLALAAPALARRRAAAADGGHRRKPKPRSAPRCLPNWPPPRTKPRRASSNRQIWKFWLQLCRRRTRSACSRISAGATVASTTASALTDTEGAGRARSRNSPRAGTSSPMYFFSPADMTLSLEALDQDAGAGADALRGARRPRHHFNSSKARKPRRKAPLKQRADDQSVAEGTQSRSARIRCRML